MGALRDTRRGDALTGDRAADGSGPRLLQPLPHYRVEYDPPARLVRVTRTREPLVLDDIARVFSLVRGSLAGLPGLPGPGNPRSDLVLLMDVRHGPANNDPAFEHAMRVPVTTLYAHFRRRAVLVRSVVGALQINRLARDRRLDDEDIQRVFFDEAPALAWLLR